MRCIWCGTKYSKEFEEISAGFCSHSCVKKWEGSFEVLCKHLSVDEQITLDTPDLKYVAG